MLKNRGGFVAMVIAILGLVLLTTLFSNILTAFETIRTYANIATFTALSTIVTIAPTLLLLLATVSSGIIYYKGAQSIGASGGDAGGLLRIVFGALTIILFVTLFLTVLTNFYTLYSDVSATNYTAFQTVTQIMPTVLFLGGIFAGGMTAYSGVKARRSRSRRAYMR